MTNNGQTATNAYLRPLHLTTCSVLLPCIVPATYSSTLSYSSTTSTFTYRELYCRLAKAVMCHTKLVIEHCVYCNALRGVNYYVSKRVVCDMHDRRYLNIYKAHCSTKDQTWLVKEQNLGFRTVKPCFIHAKFAQFIRPEAVAQLE